MLRTVGHPVAVNPDKALRKEAIDRVTSVVDELFDQDWSDREKLGELQSSEHVPLGRNKHLH